MVAGGGVDGGGAVPGGETLESTPQPDVTIGKVTGSDGETRTTVRVVGPEEVFLVAVIANDESP